MSTFENNYFDVNKTNLLKAGQELETESTDTKAAVLKASRAL